MQFMRFAERQVGFVTSLTGCHVTVRHAEIADITMSLVIQPLHQDLDCPFVVITDRSKAFASRASRTSDDCQWANISSVMPVKPNSTTPSILRRFSTPNVRQLIVGKLTFHHDWIVTLFIERWQHGLNGEIF